MTPLGVHFPSVDHVAQRADATTSYGSANVVPTVTPVPQGQETETVTLARNGARSFNVAVDGTYDPGDHAVRLSFRGVDGGTFERDLPYKLRYHWLVFASWLLLGAFVGLGIDALRDLAGKRIPVFADASDTLETLRGARAKVAIANQLLAALFDPAIAAAGALKETIRTARRFDSAAVQQSVSALQARYAALVRRTQIAPGSLRSTRWIALLWPTYWTHSTAR